MKLKRNEGDGTVGKYIVINVSKISGKPPTNAQELAAAILANPECVVIGEKGSKDEFFVMMLKDQFADKGLVGYATAAHLAGEMEYADEIHELAERSGPASPYCKRPD